MAPDPDPPTKPDDLKIQSFQWLAEAARARFLSRRGIEWKVTIGLWSFFLAGTLALVSADKWKPSFWVFIIATAISILILFVYRRWWQSYLAETGKRDQLTHFYWECKIQSVLGELLPPALRPKSTGSDGDSWERVYQCAFSKDAKKKELALDEKDAKAPDRSELVQLLIAMLFAVLFLAMLASKIWLSKPDPEKEAKRPQPIWLLETPQAHAAMRQPHPFVETC